MSNRSPKGKRKTEAVNPEVVRRKNCVLPREARSAYGNVRAKKAYGRESAEVIIPGAQTGKDLMSKQCKSL
jgi:hypothetical protein